MTSLKHIPKLFLTSLPLLSRLSAQGTATCPADGQLSCHNATVVADTCCFNAPGGQLLQTQFWDTNPSTGPSDSWTVHGLWPDHCDGSYDAYCDPNRAYTNMTAILQGFEANDLLTYMNTYWKDYAGNDASFWSHEWSKHGTCISTLSPSCYTTTTTTSPYRPQLEVLQYFQGTVDLFKNLPSYTLLANAGITPSTSKSYTLSAVESALAAGHDGKTPTVNCKNGELDEIWYHFNVRGSVQNGEFVPADPDAARSTCPTTLKYLPKGSTVPPSTTLTTSVAAPTGTGAPPGAFIGRGTLPVDVGGCIISGGTWYTSGTCATFTAIPSGTGFTLKSSKGDCGVVGGKLSCGSGVGAGVFGNNGGKLAYQGSNVWGSDAKAVGSTQETVYTVGARSVDFGIGWKAA